MLNRIICLALLTCTVCAGIARADVIYLKNGEAYAGDIFFESDVFVRLETLTGDGVRVKEFLAGEIESIEYGTMEASRPPVAGRVPTTEVDESVSPIQTVIKAAPPPAEPLQSGPGLTAIPKKEPLKIDNQVIESFLKQEDKGRQDVVETKPDDEQKAQAEEQVEEMIKPANLAFLGLAAAGALLAVSAVPLLIFGIIGFFLGRKFDDDDMEVEVLKDPTKDKYRKPERLCPTGYPVEGASFGQSASEQETPPVVEKEEAYEKRGGLIRRTIARTVDLYLGVGAVMLLYSLPGLVIPLDRFAVILMLVILLPAMFVFFFYYFFAIGKLNNTYGRYLTGVKVVDTETGERPTVKQAFKRDLLLFLWPIDVFVLIFSKVKCRIGDRWAKTKVVVAPAKTPWFIRLVSGLILGLFIYGFFNLAAPHINDRMTISQAAKDYLGSRVGQEHITRPRSVAIVNNEGRVNIKLADGTCYSVFLAQSGKDWTVTGIQEIPEMFLGEGFSIQYQYGG